MRTTNIKLTDVLIPSTDHMDPQAIATLAESIAEHGLLQPIGVKAADKGKWTVVWGRHRVTALRKLAEDGHRKANGVPAVAVPAVVIPPDTDDATVEWLRYTENGARQQFDPIAEGAAIAAIADKMRTANVDDDELAKAIAEKIGRTPGWVRSRMFLASLSGKARELVRSGRLPVNSAREIVKLADPAERDRIAEWAAGTDDRPPLALANVRHHVRSSTADLKRAPWKLDAKLDRLPVCAGCAHNSANATALFGEDETNGRTQPCGKPSCYAKKAAAASKLITLTVSKVKARRTKDKAKPTDPIPMAMVREVCPDSLVPAKVKRELTRRIVRKPDGSAAERSHRGEWRPSWQQVDKRHEAMVAKSIAPYLDALKKLDERQLLVVYAADDYLASLGWGTSRKAMVAKLAKSGYAALIERAIKGGEVATSPLDNTILATVAGVGPAKQKASLVKLVTPSHGRDLDAAAAIGAKLGVQLPKELPTREMAEGELLAEHKAKAEAKKPATRKTTAKRTTRKKAAKKKAVRRAAK